MTVHSTSRARMTKSCAADDTNEAEQIYRIAEDAKGHPNLLSDSEHPIPSPPSLITQGE